MTRMRQPFHSRDRQSLAGLSLSSLRDARISTLDPLLTAVKGGFRVVERGPPRHRSTYPWW
jgi:hypothetical protein